MSALLGPIGTAAKARLSGTAGGVTPPGNTNMPIDEAGSLAQQQAQAAKNTFMSQLTQQRQAEEMNYGDSLFNLQTQHPIDVRNLLNNYAARGMAFSSGYGDSVGTLANTYSTNLSRLAAARAQARAGFGLDRSNYDKEFGLNSAAIKQAAADRLSSAAGTLGLGNTTNPLTLSSLLQGTG